VVKQAKAAEQRPFFVAVSSAVLRSSRLRQQDVSLTTSACWQSKSSQVACLNFWQVAGSQ
jgi:hypothetical protein